MHTLERLTTFTARWLVPWSSIFWLRRWWTLWRYKRLFDTVEKSPLATSRLAKDLDVDKETVRRALKALVKLGFLDRTRRPGQTTVYGMGSAYRYVAHRRQERRLPPAREPRDPRHQSGPNLMNEPKYNPFAETRRKRDPGGLRRLSYDEMIRDLDADQGSSDYEQLGSEPSGGDGGD